MPVSGTRRSWCGAWRKFALVAFFATLSLTADAALARAPVLTSVKVSNHKATYTWTLPPGVETALVETSITPGTDLFGYFHPKTNNVSLNTPPPTATSVVDDVSFSEGTYYVHVGAHDTSLATCPGREFSDTWLFVVNSAGDGTGADVATGTPPCPAQGGGGPDKIPPSMLIKFSRRQKVDKLFVQARMDEAGTLTAQATVSMGGSSKVLRFTRVTRAVPADRLRKLRLKLRKSLLRQVKLALKRGKRLKAKVTVIARDRGGNSVTKKATIRLTS